VAVDAAGNLYADGADARVLKLAAGASTSAPLPITALTSPEGVAVDAAGNVYVADVRNKQVLKLPAQ
jgi:serine/threonine-protein kinase